LVFIVKSSLEDKEITYFKANEIGKGLPFALTTYDLLKTSQDILTPSLRDFHVIFWIKKGNGKYLVDFTEYDFQENTLILLSKSQLHYFEPFDIGLTEFHSLVFSPDFLYKTESDLQHLFQFVSTTHSEGQQILKVPGHINSKLEVMFQEMELIYTSWDSMYQSKAFYHWLCLFLIQCEMLQEAQKPTGNIAMDDTHTLLSFRELLEQNFRKEVKVDYYTEKLNLPLKTLSKLTKKYFKISPKAVIDERRILEIKRQFKGTTKSGKTIAYELNFDEPTNMFKYFRKHVGITPSEFRSQNQ
jgi:AraC family transcriptional activator of pobA